MTEPQYLSNELLKKHLNALSDVDKALLYTKIPKTYQVANVDDFLRELTRLGTNTVLNGVRGSETEPCSYLELLEKACEALKTSARIRCFPLMIRLDGFPYAAIERAGDIQTAIAQLEESLLKAALQVAYASLTAEQRRQFSQNLAILYPEQAPSISAGLVATGGALVLGNLGGFGTYMAMSSLLSTISFGALGFGAYTAASSALSLALGPIGWAAFGAIIVHRIGAPNLNVLVQNVVVEAMAAQSEARCPTLIHSVSTSLDAYRLSKLDREKKQEEARINDKKNRLPAQNNWSSFFNSLEGAGAEFAKNFKKGYRNGEADRERQILKAYIEAYDSVA
jgi:hypothetical protein